MIECFAQLAQPIEDLPLLIKYGIAELSNTDLR